jgi:hypothetical protein
MPANADLRVLKCFPFGKTAQRHLSLKSSCAIHQKPRHGEFSFVRFRVPGSDDDYWQPLILNDPILVCQLKVPLVARYSFVYQKVQSSVGSTVIPL